MTQVKLLIMRSVLILISLLIQILPPQVQQPFGKPVRFYSPLVKEDSLKVIYSFNTSNGECTSIKIIKHAEGSPRTVSDCPRDTHATMPEFEKELIFQYMPITYLILKQWIEDGHLQTGSYYVLTILYPAKAQRAEPSKGLCAKRSNKHIHIQSLCVDLTDSIQVKCVFNTKSTASNLGGAKYLLFKCYNNGKVVDQYSWPNETKELSIESEVLLRGIPAAYYDIMRDIADGLLPPRKYYSATITLIPYSKEEWDDMRKDYKDVSPAFFRKMFYL